MSLARLRRPASAVATFLAARTRIFSAPSASPVRKQHTRNFAAKAARKPQLLAQFVEHGTSFDLHGPRQELYHPREASMTRALFSEPGDFVAAAADMAECEELNPLGIPEIAFVGKSNVGKSSLLNALMRTSIVNTSKHPGRTKGLNFFGVGPSVVGNNNNNNSGLSDFSGVAGGGEGRIDPSTRALRLVDLPGYGYARVSKDTVKDLHRRVYDYLFTRDRSILMHVFILVDVRRGQPSDSDLELMRAMDREGVRYRVVLTKMDTVTSDDALKQAVVNTMHLTLKNLACDPYVSVVSAKFGVGVEELRRCIGQLVAEREIVADTMMRNMAAQQAAAEQDGDGHW